MPSTPRPCRIQRCIYKILIAVVVSREYKHDEVNRAWWTGVRLVALSQGSSLQS